MCSSYRKFDPPKFRIFRGENPVHCENRNDPDLLQVFLKKWWVESDFKAFFFIKIILENTAYYRL
jgi:hypothetical protein